MMILVALSVLNIMIATGVYRSSGSGWQSLVLTMLLGLAFAAVHTWFFHTRFFLAPPAKPFPFHQVPDGPVLALQHEARLARDVTLVEAKIFAAAITMPQQFRRRVVEEYTPDRRTLTKACTIDVEIPGKLMVGNGSKHIHIPVVLNKKGELLDDFHILHANNDETQWLSYRQYLSLAAKVLHVLLLGAEGLGFNDPLPRETDKAEMLALRGIVERRDGRASDSVDPTGVDAIRTLEVANPVALKLAVKFVEQLTSHYAIVASIGNVGTEPRHRFKYHLTQTPDVKFTSPRSSRRWSLGGYVRLVFGTRPVRLTVDIANASTAESYHLHVHAPNDLYLAGQEAVGFSSILQRTAELAPTTPHCRFRRRLGQPHAHFYCRYMPTLQERERPTLVFKFFEVPPGTVLRATITAIAAFAILWLIGFVSSRFGESDTDAPAFLLAFPALAATWLGFDAPSRKLLEGTMSARFCLILTAVLSLAGSALFLLHESYPDNFEWPKLPDGRAFLGVTDAWWAVVVGLALVNAMRIGYQCLVRTWNYSHLLAKKVE
ncbi:hypothetical protein [Umezawaea tangerina]|uniref:hypothetical protein n=1 Tax=Umezawaea tangerina TaxID=84725 RepID=UPI000A5B476E|nr:hypothetical protein [Umezawaea tangerina]